MQLAASTDTPDIAAMMREMGVAARAASAAVARADTQTKNAALQKIADNIIADSRAILAANAKDLKGARGDLTPALLDRLELTPARIQSTAEGCRQVAALPDPVGEMSELCAQPSGIKVGKMRAPLGVIGFIYESRPNVTVDASVLCLKAGNAVILRGGGEALHSNLALADCIARALHDNNLPTACVQMVGTADRAAVGELITLSEFVDVIIPRGGKSLIARIDAESTLPVIKHLDGVCHVYIDDAADNDKAVRVAFNAKARRYGVCGAMETLLVAQSKAREVLPPLASQFADKGVELRGCARTRELLPQVKAADDADWRREYLDAILSVRIVDDINRAIEHINEYGSHHTDAIVTENEAHQQKFLREVDSASVMVNASTQFADGFEYGLGAEIGISTDKLHARGPVGLEGLTSQKFVVIGDGSVRA